MTISAITWLAGWHLHPLTRGDSERTHGSPNFLTWHGIHLHVKNRGLFQHLLWDPGGRVGRDVQGVSQSRAYLMEVSSIGKEELPGQDFLIRETSCSRTPCCAVCTAFCLQLKPEGQLTFTAAPSLPLQVGHPVLPPSGLHPCVHHGAGPGGQAGARVQQAQREDDRALHRQRAGPPLLVQGTGSGEVSGASLCCCLTPKAMGEAHAGLEVHRSHPKAWGC